LEKEDVPYWNKFLQGYYDASGVSSDNFDQAIQMGGQGEVALTDDMAEKGIQLLTSVAPTVMYMGFNMLDPVIGGSGERARKLRLAISIALDEEEFISVFLNGRGVPAMHPLPPGIFGSREGRQGINPLVYDWVDGKPRRKSVDEARRLLAEAGYPGGRDAQTGEPLIVHLDTTGTGMGDKAQVDWLSKQFRKLDVQLVVRATDYNRFQDKIRKGNAQLFYWGWNADYPDPENFLFLLYGPQGKVKNQGENAANYANAEYDRLFEQMKAMPDSPARQAIIDRMLAILQHDAPWVWGFYEKAYTLQHGWMKNRKPGKIVRNTLKYQRLDIAMRERLREEWNRPVVWPLALVAVLLAALVAPAVSNYRRRERDRAV
ncbi:MAG: peptide ABC transporter substrate-binding protein, partial [Zoogloea sp.]|nr:peptide ABC transporter substrate-binding protein [Zoogloea sp.]